MITERNAVFEIIKAQEGKPCLTSIPMLIAYHGNKAAACRETGISEMTIYKYQDDVNCERHVIYNGRLMTHSVTSAVIYSKKGQPAGDRANGKA